MELRDSGLAVGDAGKWFITTALFKHGGRVVKGPFETRAEAAAVRSEMERVDGIMTRWVEQAPRVLIQFAPECSVIAPKIR